MTDPLSRRAARLVAVQAFYECHMKGRSVDMLRSAADSPLVLDEKTVPVDRELFHALLEGARDTFPMDRLIKTHLTGRSFGRIEPLVKACLRVATCELMLQQRDSPLVVSEHLTVASLFFSEREVAFINGVLDPVSKAL